MKKLTALFLALMLLCLLPILSSCEKSAYETFYTAYENYSRLDELDASMTMDMKMEMTGLSLEIPMDYNFKATGLQGDKPIFRGDMSMSAMGQNINADFYFDGTDYYISSNIIGNYRVPAANEELASDYDVIGDMNSMVTELPEELFENITFTKNEDGSKTAELTMSSEMFMSLYTDLSEELTASAIGDDSAATDISVSDIKITLTVDKDGNLSYFGTYFVMEMSMDVMGTPMEVKMTADCNVKINNPGQSVTITPIEGYQDFPDINDSIF